MADSKGMIFISLEVWDDIWRRNQFFAEQFSKRGMGPILYIVPQRDITNAVRRREWHRIKRQPIFSPQSLSDIHVTQPTKWLPNTLRWGRAVYQASVRRLIIQQSRIHGLIKPTLWINDHSASHLIGKIDHGAVVYDITDDWTSSGQSKAMLERICQQDAYLCRRADAVVVCSQRLYELKSGLVPNQDWLRLISNGVDANHYSQAVEAANATRDWPRPVFMYTGTLHTDRLDVNLVADIASKMQRGTLAFVGPSHLCGDDEKRFLASSTIRCIGAVPYQELPSWMAAADGFFVPHKLTPFTESLNPIKLWEYLAAGKPIISTPVAGFRDYPDLVSLCSAANEFAQAFAEASSEPSSKMVARRNLAAQHSWRSRVDDVEQLLRSINA